MAEIASVTGTITPEVTESAIVAGGKTIIITLTNDTWVTTGAAWDTSRWDTGLWSSVQRFDEVRQDIIDGLDSAQAEGTGWNALVRDVIGVTTVVRTSDTVATITLPVIVAYNITAAETITVTVPTGATNIASSPIVATPTFIISDFQESTGGSGGGWMRPHRGKGRKRELFDDIEHTLREAIFGPTAGPSEEEPVPVVAKGIAAEEFDKALRALTEIAEGNRNLATRVAKLRKAVAEYEARLAEEEDEEILMLVM